MISLLICMTKPIEEKAIVDMCRNKMAFISDEQLEIVRFYHDKSLAEQVHAVKQLQAAIIDITSKSGLELAHKIRENSLQTEIMIVADTTISPIRYLNPQIRASSLLLKPFEKAMAEGIILNFFKQFATNQNINGREDFFRLKKRGEDYNIACKQILYFEARDKKLYLRCGVKEYVIYETLDAVLQMLPDYFIRCHRSFLVNRFHIGNVKYAENTICMDNDDMIPLSRSYKSMVKGLLANE